MKSCGHIKRATISLLSVGLDFGMEELQLLRAVLFVVYQTVWILFPFGEISII